MAKERGLFLTPNYGNALQLDCSKEEFANFCLLLRHYNAKIVDTKTPKPKMKFTEYTVMDEAANSSDWVRKFFTRRTP